MIGAVVNGVVILVINIVDTIKHRLQQDPLVAVAQHLIASVIIGKNVVMILKNVKIDVHQMVVKVLQLPQQQHLEAIQIKIVILKDSYV